MRNVAIWTIKFAVAVPLSLVGWYFAATRWAAMDALTMRMPQGVRNIVAKNILRRTTFKASDLPVERRAVRLNPLSEEGLAFYCSVAAEDGRDIPHILQVCNHARSLMHRGGFNAGLIVDGYAKIHRPCEGLDLLRLFSGEDMVNTSLMAQLGVLETSCGQMDSAEGHFREALRRDLEDMAFWRTGDGPPLSDDFQSYEQMDRVKLSKARSNLSALLTVRGKSAEAFALCRAAKAPSARQCTCHFTGGTVINLSSCDVLSK